MVVFRDPSLPHQIKLVFWGHAIAVTCTCGATCDVRMRWDDPREPIRLWRAHMTEVTNGRASAVHG